MCVRGLELLSGRCATPNRLSVREVHHGSSQEIVNRLADDVTAISADGRLDTGYPMASVSLLRPPDQRLPTPRNETGRYVHEIQRVVLVGKDGFEANGSGTASFRGELTFSFNGETTWALALEALIRDALPLEDVMALPPDWPPLPLSPPPPPVPPTPPPLLPPPPLGCPAKPGRELPVVIDGYNLLVGGEPLFLKGVAWSPFGSNTSPDWGQGPQ